MKAETKLSKVLKKGDSEILKNYCETIYIKYSNLVFHIAFDILGNKEDAEDVVSETFVSFFSKLNDQLKLKNTKYYLVNTARYISYEKKRKTEKVVEFNDDIQLENPSFKLNIDYKKMLRQLSDVLNDEEMEIVVLHIELDMKFREIAKLKNTSVFSISGKYKRAIDKVKRKLRN